MVDEPKFPSMVSIDKRLSSFNFWHRENFPNIQALSDAGFFYTGESDRVLCFHCGGVLFHWAEGADPDSQHLFHFPKCKFILRKLDLQDATERFPEANSETRVLSPSDSQPSTSRELDDDNACQICYAAERNCIFLPCGHLYTCVSCARRIGNQCPICRKLVLSIKQVFKV